MDDISLPDESFTISSMSQSPFQGRSRQKFSNTNGTHEQSNDNEGTLGKSELDALYSNNDINKTGTNKSLSITQRNNQTAQSLINVDSEEEIDPNDMPQDESESGYMSNIRPQRRQRDNSINQVSLDESNQSHYRDGRDSPDFNRYHRNNSNDTYNLTVSQAGISNQNTSYRTTTQEINQNTKRSTFADSVITQQYNQYTSGSNNNTHRHQYQQLESQRNQGIYKHDEGVIHSTDENNFEDSPDQQDQEQDNDGHINESDQSAVEDFGHLSVHQKSQYTTSRMGLSRFMPRGAIADDMMSKRSPLMMKRDEYETSSLSPLSNGGHDFNFSQTKSFINNTTSNNKAINRTVGSNNPLNQLATNLPQMLNNQLANRTQIPVEKKKKNTIQSDLELEETLEEHSQNQTLQRHNTLEDSKESHNTTGNQQNQIEKLGQQSYKMSQLKIENRTLRAEVERLYENAELKDNKVSELESIVNDIQSKLVDKDEHLRLLILKCKDETELPKLRTKNLELARKETQQLNREIIIKNKQIQHFENLIKDKELEDNIQIQVYQDEMKNLHMEIAKLQILVKGKQRQTQDIEIEIQKREQLYLNNLEKQDQHFQIIIRQKEEQFEKQSKTVKDLQKMIKQYETQLNKAQAQYDQQLKSKDLEVKQEQDQIIQMEDIICQKDKIIEKIEKEKEKFQNEMKNFKERCKQLELELESAKGFENNSLFGNQSYMNVTNQQSKKNDYEIKQMKEVYDKKLNKVTEDLAKKTTQVKELDVEVLRLREELKTVQITSTSDRLEKDQEIIKQLTQTKQELNVMKQLEQDIRYYFNIEDNENIGEKITKISQDINSIPFLQQQMEKLVVTLEDAQKQLIEAKTKQSTEQMSNFLRKNLLEKDKQIEDLDKKYAQEKETRTKIQDEMFELQKQFSTLKLTNEKLQYDLDHLTKELTKTKESKVKAEQNVEEVKEKLRVMLREQQEMLQQSNKKQQQTPHFDEEKKKSEELVSLVLQLNLAKDPLQSVNLSLQESYLDEYEQARKHLQEQSKLVLEQIQQLEKEKNHILEEMENEKSLLMAQNEKEKFIFIETIANLENEIKGKTTQIEDLKQQINEHHDQVKEYLDQIKEKGQKLENVSSIIKEKDSKIERDALEINQLIEHCERLSRQQIDIEELNVRLRQELEDTNINIRKVMRTQEHLHKDNKKNLGNSKYNEKCKFSNEENERIMMAYEDGVSKIAFKEKKQSDEQIIQMRELYRSEVLEMFDKLIDSSTKMPTFNDLALQISERIDKVRHQERMKFNTEMQQENNKRVLPPPTNVKSLKSSQSNGENYLVETFKNEMDSINNEDELVQSIAKWLKQSQNNAQVQQPFTNKNFIQNEDHSLIFSELFSAQPAKVNNQQDQVQQQLISQLNNEISSLKQENETLIVRIEEFEQEIDQRLKQINDLQDIIRDQENLIKQLKDEIRLKESNIRESEEMFSMRNRDVEEQSRQRNQQMWKEVESLKDQIRQELLLKTQQLDQEFDDLEIQRQKQREQLAKQQQELEQKYAKKLEQQEKDFMAKLHKMELEIKSSHEKSQDDLLSNIHKSLEEQYQSKIKQITEEFQSQISTLKQDSTSKIDDQKRIKERELKKLKEEMDRMKKSQEDKIKKMEIEFQNDKDSIEREYKEKIEAMIQKHKKDIKNAQDKVRAEMRNQLDNLRNEQSKIKIDYEREKKKLLQDNENVIENQRRESDDKFEQELKQLRLQHDKQMKKKLDDKERECNKKLQELEQEFTKLQQIHQESLKKERERLEVLLKDQLKSDIRMELQQEFECDYNQQIEKIRQQSLQEIERIKTRYEQQEKASKLPAQVYQEQREFSMQCNICCDLENQGIYTSSCCDNESNYSCSMRQQRQQQEVSASMITTVEQMRERFQEEMERQREVFEVQLVAKQSMSVRIFEEIMTLEFDKILQSIYHKAQSSLGQPVSMKALDIKRKEINNLINDIINRNDDRKEHQMKVSLENMKKKISEVLKIFKQEVENKYNKRIQTLQAALNKGQTVNQQEAQQQIQQVQTKTEEQLLKERLRLPNMSEILSKDDEESVVSSNRKYTQQLNNGSSNLPTPRTLDMQESNEQSIRNPTPGKKIILDNSNQLLSDLKKYTSQEEEQEQANILKKICPIENSKGVFVVEVEKVVRDLIMLFTTIKNSKFYKTVMASDNEKENNNYQDIPNSTNNDVYLQMYRNLLNDFFKMIVKMNQGVDQLSKQSEVYKLKLLNTELREKLQKTEAYQKDKKYSNQIEELLTYFQGSRLQSLNQEAKECLKTIENTQFKINKMQYKLYSIVDLFSIDGDTLNKNIADVNLQCREYCEQNPLENQLQEENLIQSQYSPDQNKKNFSPELLSPEETAQLIASVFQKLNQTYANINNQHPLDTYQSFFQTFLSNEDYVKSAENFIQKYREQMNYTQNYNKNNLPLQTTQNQILNRTKQYQSVQLQNLNNNKKRCRSQSNGNESEQLPLQPTNHFQSQVSNVFNSNHLMQRQNSVHSYQPILVSNYDTQSQQSFLTRKQYTNTIPSNVNFGKANMPYQSIQNRNNNFAEEVSSAQNNVNLKFAQLKNNLLYNNSSNSGHTSRDQSFQ